MATVQRSRRGLLCRVHARDDHVVPLASPPSSLSWPHADHEDDPAPCINRACPTRRRDPQSTRGTQRCTQLLYSLSTRLCRTLHVESAGASQPELYALSRPATAHKPRSGSHDRSKESKYYIIPPKFLPFSDVLLQLPSSNRGVLHGHPPTCDFACPLLAAHRLRQLPRGYLSVRRTHA